MLRTPSPVLRRTVGAVKLGVAATVAFLAIGPVLVTTQDVASEQGQTPGQAQGPTVTDVAAHTELASLMARHDCSATGFGPGVIPGSALVERDARIEQVSFDDGWAVYTGDAAGALLAVCRSSL